MHFRVTGEWNGEPFNRVIEAEDINDCYNHWMLWAQIAHADVTNIRIEELKEHQAAWWRFFIAWFAGSIPYSEIALMQHELQPDSLVDLKFIMADTGFGKTFIYDRIKSGDLPKAKVIHGRARWLYRDHCEFKNKLLSRANG